MTQKSCRNSSVSRLVDVADRWLLCRSSEEVEYGLTSSEGEVVENYGLSGRMYIIKDILV